MRDVHIGHPLPGNRFLRWLLAGYGGVWIAAAIAPDHRADWLLENLVVFAFVGLLAATHRRFAFSNFSYLLIALFLALHAWGAHHTYSLNPFGFWLQDALGLTRNHYDRIVHFAFGLLLIYPVREIARRTLHLHGAWAWAVPMLAILSLSSGYEIIESWAARIVDPELGTAFLGTQGDEWDAQKDMSLALVGGAITMALASAYQRRTGHEAWMLLR
jgi:putative membrane protein